jgi:hypothetical protein
MCHVAGFFLSFFIYHTPIMAPGYELYSPISHIFEICVRFLSVASPGIGKFEISHGSLIYYSNVSVDLRRSIALIFHQIMIGAARLPANSDTRMSSAFITVQHFVQTVHYDGWPGNAEDQLWLECP